MDTTQHIGNVNELNRRIRRAINQGLNERKRTGTWSGHFDRALYHRLRQLERRVRLDSKPPPTRQ